VGRIAMENVEHGEATVKQGERLVINFPAANRDPEVFENPDEAVLDRQKNRHIAFGIGIHRCAGSNLARMEMEVALKTWFARIPEFELTDAEAVVWAPGQVRGARKVPVRF
jgi:cytochrome P450